MSANSVQAGSGQSDEMTATVEALLRSGKNYDVELVVGEEPNVERFQAHSTILRKTSVYFNMAFSPQWAKKHGDMYYFRKPNIRPKVFKPILRYLYTGQFDLEMQSTDWIALLIAADELNLMTFVEHVQDHLIAHVDKWKHTHLVRFHHGSAAIASCHRLHEYCEDLIVRDPSLVFGSPLLPTVTLSQLRSIVIRDDLAMRAVDVWNSIIAWGIANTQQIPRDVSTWCDKDFSHLRNTLQDVPGKVRFIHIGARDFFHYVHPYHAILPKQLYDAVLRMYLEPEHEIPCELLKAQCPLNTPAESLLTFQQAHDVIASAKAKHPSTKSATLALLLCGEREHSVHQIFHYQCDERGIHVNAGKIASTKETGGVHVPTAFSSVFCPADAFTFSLGNSRLRFIVVLWNGPVVFIAESVRWLGASANWFVEYLTTGFWNTPVGFLLSVVFWFVFYLLVNILCTLASLVAKKRPVL